MFAWFQLFFILRWFPGLSFSNNFWTVLKIDSTDSSLPSYKLQTIRTTKINSPFYVTVS